MSRFVVGLGLVAALVGLAAGPAGAHTGYALPSATNLRTQILAVTMPVEGVVAASVDLGDQLELRGTPAVDLDVIGYQDEPMVRTGPDGVYVNARSPSIGGDLDYGEHQRDPDPAAEPEWVRVGPPGSVRWHDHRAHWMGVGDPPAAAEAPEREHVIVERWVVPLVAGDQVGSIEGDLRWLPASSPLPWLALAGLTLVAVLVPMLVGRDRLSVVAASVVLVLASAVVIVGWVLDGSPTAVQALGVGLPPVLGAGVLGVLATRFRRPGERAARLVVGIVGLALVVVPIAPLVVSAPFGSQVVSSFDAVVVRAAASLVLGSGVGLVLVLVMPYLGGRSPAGGGTPRGGPRRVRRPPLLARPSGRPTRRPSAPGSPAPGPGPTSPAADHRSVGFDPGERRGRDWSDVSPHTPLDDLDELARRAGAGDEAALEQFVRRTQPDVWRLCRYLVDAQSADDLTAEVYEHALRALPSYRGRPNGAARGPRVGARRRGRFLARPGMQDEDAGGAPGTDGPGAGTGTDEASTGPADGESRSTARAWLLTIARRRCADEIRRRVRDRRAHERLGAGPTEMPAGDGEVALQDALARLDEDRRSAFVLTQVLGLAYQEAADVVGCPVGTIRSRVARARDDLIVALGATPAGEAAGSDVTIGRGPR